MATSESILYTQTVMLFGKERTLRREKSWLIEVYTESILTKHALLQLSAL